MTNLQRRDQDEVTFDSTHFKLQPDGTFRISIRGIAAMAGIDQGALTRALKSADAENALPVARSLLAQGFYPDAVSTWGETGGIPEDAAPFILEHYAFTATSPSAQARAVLLSFSRVGINAYLKDKLGVAAANNNPEPPLALSPVEQAAAILSLVNSSLDILDRLGGPDDRDCMVYRDLVNNTVVRSSGNALLPPPRQSLTLSEALIQLGAPPHKATKFATRLGKAFKDLYRSDHDGQDPPTHKQQVGGHICEVADYDETWLASRTGKLKEWLSDLLG